jgi:hypothetical protein
VESDRLQGFPVEGAFASLIVNYEMRLCCVVLRQQDLLELRGRPIARRGMQMFVAVHLFDKAIKRRSVWRASPAYETIPWLKFSPFDGF